MFFSINDYKADCVWKNNALKVFIPPNFLSHPIPTGAPPFNNFLEAKVRFPRTGLRQNKLPTN